MKRIALYGIGGLYNYGCEAIVRGTVVFARRAFGEDVSITYYSKNYNEDKKITDSLGIEIVSIESRPSFIKKCISKAIDVFKLPIVPFKQKEYEIICNNSDVIISIGGDLYSIPKYLRQQKKYRYVNPIVEFGNYALKAGKKIIIYGASIGPFGNYSKAIAYYTEHLKNVDSIICRESQSVQYLKQLGITDNVVCLPDPAFLIDDTSEFTTAKNEYIGVNLSRLSLQELNGAVNESKIVKIANILSDLSDRFNKPLMLIPHVFSKHTVEDNDLLFLREVFEKLSSNTKSKSCVVEPKSFMDAKRYIKQCYFVICARMHCGVNAVTSGIPALFLEYSIKSKGMAQFIYESDLWSMPLTTFETDIIERCESFKKKMPDILHRIDELQSQVDKEYSAYFAKMEKEKNE